MDKASEYAIICKWTKCGMQPFVEESWKKLIWQWIDKEDIHDRKKWRMNVMKRKSNPIGRLQMTHHTSGWAVTAVTNCCTNCVGKNHRPQQWGPDLGKAAMWPRWMAGTDPHKSGWCRDKSRSDNHNILWVDNNNPIGNQTKTDNNINNNNIFYIIYLNIIF